MQIIPIEIDARNIKLLSVNEKVNFFSLFIHIEKNKNINAIPNIESFPNSEKP